MTSLSGRSTCMLTIGRQGAALSVAAGQPVAIAFPGTSETCGLSCVCAVSGRHAAARSRYFDRESVKVHTSKKLL